MKKWNERKIEAVPWMREINKFELNARLKNIICNIRATNNIEWQDNRIAELNSIIEEIGNEIFDNIKF